MNIKLTDADWLKLRDFNKVISKKIKQDIPVDWDLSLEEIQSAVYDTYIKLLSNYKLGAMSPTSYCWQYAEKWTYNTLMAEYRRLKQQYEYDDLFGEDKDDDEPCRHTIIKADLEHISIDDAHTRNLKIMVKEIYEKMPKIDQMIAKMIFEGYSYDEISKHIGIDKKTAIRHMKKYAKLFD